MDVLICRQELYIPGHLDRDYCRDHWLLGFSIPHGEDQPISRRGSYCLISSRKSCPLCYVSLRMKETIVSHWSRRIATDGDRPALHVKNSERYEVLTWNQLATEVRKTAATLRRMSIRPSDRVVQVSPNRLEWILCDLACHLIQAVHVPIHATLSGQQIAWQINHSQANVAFLAGAEEISKLKPHLGSLANCVFCTYDVCPDFVTAKPVTTLAEENELSEEGNGLELERGEGQGPEEPESEDEYVPDWDE